MAADAPVAVKLSAATPISINMRFVFIDNMAFYRLNTATASRVVDKTIAKVTRPLPVRIDWFSDSDVRENAPIKHCYKITFARGFCTLTVRLHMRIKNALVMHRNKRRI